MTEPLYALLVWLGALSLLAFLLFGWDKLMAKCGRQRIAAVSLLVVCGLGGALGGLLGMYLFRHKIRKPTFRIAIPLLALAYLAFLFVIYLAL